MTITVELFGIPRSRAGAARVELEADSLHALLDELVRRFPDLADECIDSGRLRAGYLANLNGERFVTDPATPLHAGDAILILSADAGG